ncbi:MAG: DEAD/DEAH box helicase family protein [Oscillospiraceae bacterium]|nr:DEAD/DEAH box helicase family protein [Oscillospiraceae bacterium]
MSGKSKASGGFWGLIQTAVDEGTLSSKEIAEAINEFRRLYNETEERERREEQERKRAEAERIAREDQEREQAHIAAVTSMELPMDWENVFQSDSRTQGVHLESIPDALIRSLTELGCVDIEYISSITGADLKTVIVTLKGSIYQNPMTWDECFYKGWETSDEYLSGNLMRKRKEAKEANKKYDGYFSENLRAIDAVLPPAIAADDIYVTLGSPWIPPDIIDDFIEEVFGKCRHGYWSSGYWSDSEEQSHTVHDELTGTWEIPNKSRYHHSARVRNTYGTERIEAMHILERTLNMKSVVVTDEIDCPANASGKKRVINEAETAAAIEKQQKLIRKFQRWVWTDPKRKKRLERIFAERYSCVRRRIFDGSFLEFPGMSPSVQLYPYQKNAVARILFTPNTLLAHDVGAGKTYIMIAASQELRRMGLSKKNMYVVPNNLVGQWRQIFTEMYPSANLLCVEPKCFSPKKRNDILKQIRDEDYDGILIAYSCFGQIPLSKNYCIDSLREKIDRLREQNAKTKYSIPRLKTMIKTLERKLASLEAEAIDSADKICFDELGITRLFVDEAHNFKNVPIDTKTDTVLGINSTGSLKCLDMMEKVHMVQKQNNGKGTVLATGTPVTNSVTDVFIMQSYLQSGELGLLDLQSFDGWVGMFAERVTEFEIDVDTTSYRLATRFARFHNLPELTALLSSVADFHEVDKSAGIPDCDGHHDSVIAKSPEFADYLLRISERAEDIRKGRVKRTEDNMLKITGDGRKAALDMRLVDTGLPFTYHSKVARCAENTADIYHKTSANHGTQLIFCDVSTPKAGFNIYDELKRLLTGMGVPEDQIAYIHDAETEKQRSLLFSKVRSGAVRILIGSTFKLGLGVNVQDRLIALHHIDVPWRPADMTQREGRILRQGNQNSKVYIYRYITEGSFDAYSWQLLETKQRFINDLLSGSLTQRSGSDIEDTVLDYAEVKALAVGNPLVKKRVETANELNRYLVLQRKAVESKLRIEKEVAELPGKIAHQQELIESCRKDAEYYAQWRENNLPEQDKGKAAEYRKQVRSLLCSALREHELQPHEKELLTYRGFRIVLPANMSCRHPFVWAARAGRYYVELGDTETGNLIRIDNRLDTLDTYLEQLHSSLRDLLCKQGELRAELASADEYSEQIAHYREKLERLDKKLGVHPK